jgi:hypothetical protein
MLRASIHRSRRATVHCILEHKIHNFYAEFYRFGIAADRGYTDAILSRFQNDIPVKKIRAEMQIGWYQQLRVLISAVIMSLNLTLRVKCNFEIFVKFEHALLDCHPACL